jgi:hypothetical protein
MKSVKPSRDLPTVTSFLLLPKRTVNYDIIVRNFEDPQLSIIGKHL